MSEKNKIGLVLSGGGFRGMAHIGVIKYLEEQNIVPSHVAGTSAGALVGAFYAAGYSSDQTLDFFLKTKVFSWRNYAFRSPGMLNPLKFSSALAEYFPDYSFNNLKHRFSMTRTNLETGEGETIDQGLLIPNILASAAIPLLFAPVEIDGAIYADGGITNNFPVEALLGNCDKIIGVYVNRLDHKPKDQLVRAVSIMERALSISISANCIPKFKHCDIMIAPEELMDHSLIDVNHIQDIFDIGYRAAAVAFQKAGDW